MKLRDFRLLTDENIHSDVVQFLRSEGSDVLDVREESLHGTPDINLLRRAVSESRVVLTHDSDFGTLAIFGGEAVVGIVYLRPGHIDPQFTIDSVVALFREELDLTPPFIVVARRTGSHVTIRLRTL